MLQNSNWNEGEAIALAVRVDYTSSCFKLKLLLAYSFIQARVRFKEGVAKDVLENLLAHNNNKLVIDGAQYKARVLEGKEEATYFATYWDTFVDTKNNRSEELF